MGSSWSTSEAGSEPYSMTDNQCYINSPEKKTAYEWHLNDRNDSALKKAKKFRSHYEKLYAPKHWLVAFLLRSNSIVKDSIYAIEKVYLDDIDKSKDENSWEEINCDLKAAAENNDPISVIRAYTRSQLFSKQINGGMARNTYHELTFYCTSLNCNVLARTQDGIQAFISILFHPKLNEYKCNGNITVYRGAVIDNECVLEGYKKGAIIITTTLLSTSKDPAIADAFRFFDFDPKKPNQISVSWKYYIHNYRHTALEIEKYSSFPNEKEILIYPYIPFRIMSFTKTTIEQIAREKIEIELEEIGDDDENSNSDNQILWTAI